MNPNAPEHQPEVMRNAAVVRQASNKIFSYPDPWAVEKISKHTDTYDRLRQEKSYIEQRNRLYSRSDPAPIFPLITKTPSPTESNVGTNASIHLGQVMFITEMDHGTPSNCTDAYLELICDFANKWYSKKTGVDCRSTGTDPKFTCLNSNFRKNFEEYGAEWLAGLETTRYFTRAQFWKLRYLFIPISFVASRHKNKKNVMHHVALCAISPEARTVDYICSAGDNGLKLSNRTNGSRFTPKIFQWLAAFLGKDAEDGFYPYEWKLRTDAAKRQDMNGYDCAIYSITHAMSLAFGWGYTPDPAAFPPNHQQLIYDRRLRIVQDFICGGFEFWKEGDENLQYYPVIDKVPEAKKEDGFRNLAKEVTDALPSWAKNRRACYVGCPGKQMLKVHCRRNNRWYVGWENPEVSGSGRTYHQFLEWVEEVDRFRKRRVYPKGRKPLPYPEYQPPEWIDPEHSNANAAPPGPLWSCPNH